MVCRNKLTTIIPSIVLLFEAFYICSHCDQLNPTSPPVLFLPIKSSDLMWGSHAAQWHMCILVFISLLPSSISLLSHLCFFLSSLISLKILLHRYTTLITRPPILPMGSLEGTFLYKGLRGAQVDSRSMPSHSFSSLVLTSLSCYLFFYSVQS